LAQALPLLVNLIRFGIKPEMLKHQYDRRCPRSVGWVSHHDFIEISA
jgi:hypothetical protein